MLGSSAEALTLAAPKRSLAAARRPTSTSSSFTLSFSSVTSVSSTLPCQPLKSLEVDSVVWVKPFSERSPRLSKPSARASEALVGRVGLSAKQVKAQPPSTGLPTVTRVASISGALAVSAMVSP